MNGPTLEEQAGYRLLAQRLVTAETEDVLTTSDRDTPPGEQYSSDRGRTLTLIQDAQHARPGSWSC
jgi:hypothetical protein